MMQLQLQRPETQMCFSWIQPEDSTTKKNLMNQLGKINKILESEYPDAYRETLVVLDATTGQNALVQRREEFSDVAKISGIGLLRWMVRLKGGIAVAIQSELSVPVKYIGVGETIDDLQKFDSDRS